MKRFALLALALSACFSPDEPPCSFACGPMGECPDDYMCLPDGYCHKSGDNSACGYSDAAMPDVAEPVDLAGADASMADGNEPTDGNPADLTPPADLIIPCNTPNDCGSATCNGATFSPQAACVAHACVFGQTIDCSAMTTNKLCSVAAGGCVQCNGDGDCPAASCAGTVFTPAGTCSAHVCSTPSTTDCSTTSNKFCSATGCVQCNGDGDCPAASCSGQVFTPAGTCSAHTCSTPSATDCSTMTTNKQCSVAGGGCVQCNGDGDCPAASCSGAVFTPASTCSAHTCGTPSSADCSTMPTTKQCSVAGGGCVQCNGNGDCPAASCSGQVFTPASTCSAHVCSAPATTDCSTMAINKQCSAPTGCVQCNMDADCGLCAATIFTPGTCASHACTPGTPMDCAPLACSPTMGCM